MKVRDLIRRVEQEGWILDRTSGDHRQYVHPERPGVVTISGHPSDDAQPRNLASVLRQAGISRRSLHPKRRPKR